MTFAAGHAYPRSPVETFFAAQYPSIRLQVSPARVRLWNLAGIMLTSNTSVSPS